MPKIYTEQELKEVWNLYRTGYKRKDIADMLDTTPDKITYIWEIAYRRWGKGPRITTSPVTPQPAKQKLTRPPAEYSNPQYCKLY